MIAIRLAVTDVQRAVRQKQLLLVVTERLILVKVVMMATRLVVMAVMHRVRKNVPMIIRDSNQISLE